MLEQKKGGHMTTRRQRGRTPPQPTPGPARPADWGPWEWRNHLADPRSHLLKEIGNTWAQRSGMKRACLNAVYSVQFFERESRWGVIDHLLIRRHDGKSDIPWLHMQRIKDDLCGAERVAVEVFPPVSQLVDDANCRHIWCLPGGFELPFGLHLEGWKH
jgi:hypothetical protein